MNNKNFLSPKGIFLGSVVLTAISVILRTLNLLLFFDSDIGYYQIGSVLPVISACFLGVGLIGFLVLAIVFFGSKKQYIEYRHSTPFKIVGCVLSVIAALFLSASTLPAAFAGDKLALLCSVLSFTGALYFPCACMKLGTIYRLITGLSLIARITCMMGIYYFDQNITMNAPDKTIFCVACIFGMWIIVSEIKAIMGEVRPWLYITATVGASVLCASASLPSIIKFHADKTFVGSQYANYWLLFALAIYAFSMLCCYSVNVKENEAEEGAPRASCATGNVATEDVSTIGDTHSDNVE